MATIRFFIASKKEFATIYVRFRNGNDFDLTSTTKLLVRPETWSQDKQEVRNKVGAISRDVVNKALLGLKLSILESYTSSCVQRESVNSEWLKKVIAKFFNQPEPKSNK